MNYRCLTPEELCSVLERDISDDRVQLLIALTRDLIEPAAETERLRDQLCDSENLVESLREENTELSERITELQDALAPIHRTARA